LSEPEARSDSRNAAWSLGTVARPTPRTFPVSSSVQPQYAGKRTERAWRSTVASSVFRTTRLA
jgi:hypothetical protein